MINPNCWHIIEYRMVKTPGGAAPIRVGQFGDERTTFADAYSLRNKYRKQYPERIFYIEQHRG